MRRSLPLLALAALAAACATPGGMMAAPAGTHAIECRSPLRACLVEPEGMVNSVRMGGLRWTFASAVYEAHPNPDKCDVAFSFPATFNDRATLTSAYTGEVLGTYTGGYMDNIRDACKALAADGGPLASKLPATAFPAPRPAAAVAAAPVAAPPAAPAGPVLPPPVAPNFQLAEHGNDLAVVVGVEDYPDLPKAKFAERDAAAFKAHVRALGVPERNIAYLSGSRATKSAIEKDVETWLVRLAKPDSRVYFYFSGHGAPEASSGEAYLVPVDGDPNFLANTGYPVRRLYERLGMLPAKQVLVAMDACFSGAGGRSLLASGARPLLTRIETGSVPRNVVALTASASDEISGSLDAEGHGAFTYFLLKGLDGAAKDSSGHVTPKSLLEYARPRVQDEARRLNRDQTPQLAGGDPGLILR